GSVGALTYNTWRGINIVKARAGPTKQYEDAQVNVRTKAAAATASWQSLPDSRRALWATYANTHADVDWTGNPQRITAYNWYIRINVRRQLLDQGIGQYPPAIVFVTNLQTLTLEDMFGFLQANWTHTPAAPPAFTYAEFYGCGPHSAGSNPTIKQCKRLDFEPIVSHTWDWNVVDSGWYTLFARPIHLTGIVAGWIKARAELL
ncbi:unnamed protein product, partial [marine sediment metagenome]